MQYHPTIDLQPNSADDSVLASLVKGFFTLLTPTEQEAARGPGQAPESPYWIVPEINFGLDE